MLLTLVERSSFEFFFDVIQLLCEFSVLSRVCDVRYECMRTGRMWISLSALLCDCAERKEENVPSCVIMLSMTLTD